MADNTDFTPELTLTPDMGAAAAAEAPKAPDAPSLTLNPTVAPEDAAEAQKVRDANAVKLDESQLTEAERKMVNEFAQKIDIKDSNVVLQYGAAAQKNIASFSENTLNSVRTKDLGEIGQSLAGLVGELQNFGQEEKSGLFGFFQKKKNDLESMKAQYAKAETNVNKIVAVLEGHQVTLMKDIAMLDQMYDLNTKYYKELTMYILAGKKRLEQVRAGELEELRKKAAQSGAQEDAQAYNDLANMCSRFEKKIHDLELTRMISIQMGTQTAVEEPDGPVAGSGALPAGHGGPERRHQHDQRALAEERRHAQDGHHRDRQGGRAQRGGYPDPAAHQSAAHLHPRRGHEDPAGRRPEAPGGRAGAGTDRGRAQAEAAGAARLSRTPFVPVGYENKECL